jgi:hypothetical protein
LPPHMTRNHSFYIEELVSSSEGAATSLITSVRRL